MPCQRTQYDPLLSHSQLDKQNIENIVFGTNEMTPRKQAIRDRFLDAREQRSRFVKDIYEYDHKTFTKAIDKINAVITTFDSASTFMASSDTLARHLGVGDPIGQIGAIFSSMYIRSDGSEYDINDLFRDMDYRMSYRDDIRALTSKFDEIQFFYDRGVFSER